MRKRWEEIALCINEQVAAQIWEVPIPDHAADCADNIDAAGATCGFKPIGKRWREIDPKTAEKFLQYHIAHDLAYSHDALIEPQLAASLAHELVSIPRASRWFTSHSAAEFPNNGYGFSPLTDWTFDVGYACFGDETILLIVFQAED